MNEKIQKIYRSILEYSGNEVGEDGLIYQSIDKDRYAVIGELPLVFPCRVQFDDPNQNKYYFHPFSESYIRGESEVISWLKENIAVRLNWVTAVVGRHLLMLLGSPELHKQLNEEQASLLMMINEADDKTSVNWSNMIPTLIKSNHDSAYVKLYLKKSGTWKGSTWSRLCVTTFPFYRDLKEGKYERLRVKDRASFIKVMEFIYPDIGTPEAYNYGTRTKVAPFLDALMQASALVASRLNDILMIYRDYIPEADEMLFNMDWLSYFDDLDALRQDIKDTPELRGNAGTLTVAERQHPPQEMSYNRQSSSTAQIPTPEPVHQPTQQTQVPQYQQPQPQPVQQPQTNTQQQATPPPVRVNERGAVNFSDVIRANPALAYQANPLAATLYKQQVDDYIRRYGVPPPNYAANQPPPPPSWATPQPQPGYPPPGYPQYPPGYPPPGYPQQQPGYQQPPPGYPQYPQGYNPNYPPPPGFPIQPVPNNPNIGQPPPPPGWSWR